MPTVAAAATQTGRLGPVTSTGSGALISRPFLLHVAVPQAFQILHGENFLELRVCVHACVEVCVRILAVCDVHMWV